MNSLVLGLVLCFAAYLLVDFICQKLEVEKLVKGKKSIKVGMLLGAIALNIMATSIIENFIAREYRFLIRSFFVGATSYLIIFLLLVNNKKTKL